MDINKQYIDEHPDYIDILDKIIQLEKNLDTEEFKDRGSLERFNEKHDTDHNVYWRNNDIAAHPSKLYQLEVNGFIDRVVDTNSTTCYSMSDHRDEIEQFITEFKNKYNDGTRVEMHDFPDEDELPESLFDEIINYDDIKWLLKRSLTTDGISNFLFLGPPGCGKTLFLRSIHNYFKDAQFVFGGEATSAGYYDVIFDKTPKYMLFDEIGDMDNDNQKSLTGYTEEGIISETKHEKSRILKTNANTYATANYRKNIVDKIYDRFEVLEFEPYDYDEFMEVCKHLLPMEEGKDKEESKLIGEAVWDMKNRGDVRQALRIARLSDGDPHRVVKVLQNYSSDNQMSELLKQ